MIKTQLILPLTFSAEILKQKKIVLEKAQRSKSQVTLKSKPQQVEMAENEENYVQVQPKRSSRNRIRRLKKQKLVILIEANLIQIPENIKEFMGFKEFSEKLRNFQDGVSLIDFLNQQKLMEDDLSVAQKYYYYFLIKQNNWWRFAINKIQNIMIASKYGKELLSQMLKQVKESLYSEKKDRIFPFDAIKCFISLSQPYYALDTLYNLKQCEYFRSVKTIEYISQIIDISSKLGLNFMRYSSSLVQEACPGIIKRLISYSTRLTKFHSHFLKILKIIDFLALSVSRTDVPEYQQLIQTYICYIYEAQTGKRERQQYANSIDYLNDLIVICRQQKKSLKLGRARYTREEGLKEILDSHKFHAAVLLLQITARLVKSSLYLKYLKTIKDELIAILSLLAEYTTILQLIYIEDESDDIKNLSQQAEYNLQNFADYYFKIDNYSKIIKTHKNKEALKDFNQQLYDILSQILFASHDRPSIFEKIKGLKLYQYKHRYDYALINEEYINEYKQMQRDFDNVKNLNKIYKNQVYAQEA
ncbi:UNKNOWN [Stylonychia lemnae]|uniref:Uncharacterized protein n=1 Tax=Stylonychia lemnae TaxID=5949 RepID=A0A078A5T1_STYLE|nr:UNKNOWN [Stylonychia lemnae]|eukprot:CDW76119.1 UNKNOWN [Stylonychia lemnae]